MCAEWTGQEQGPREEGMAEMMWKPTTVEGVVMGVCVQGYSETEVRMRIFLHYVREFEKKLWLICAKYGKYGMMHRICN